MGSSTSREYNIIRETGNRKQSDLLTVLLFFSLLIIGAASPVYADWNVNLSDYQTNENLTVTGGRLVLGSNTTIIPGQATLMAWVMNDSTETEYAYDLGVYNNSGSRSGSAWTYKPTTLPGGSGSEFVFDGSGNQRVVILTNTESLNTTYSEFSVGGFLKTNETYGGVVVDTSYRPSSEGWFATVNSTGFLNCSFYMNDSGVSLVSVYAPVANQTWTHWACGYNQSVVWLAINGVLVSQNQTSEEFMIESGEFDQWTLARHNDGLFPDFNGSMVGVGAYNFTLNATQLIEWNDSKTAYVVTRLLSNVSTLYPSGYSIYQFDPSSPIIIRAATVTKDNNVNVTVSYSVYEGSWSAYTTDISPYINNQYSNLRVNVTVTNGNATNPWVSSITIVRGTGIDLLASLINSVGTVLSAIIGIVPQVITLIAYFAVGGFVGGLFFMILDKMSTGGGSK